MVRFSLFLKAMENIKVVYQYLYSHKQAHRYYSTEIFYLKLGIHH